MPDALPSPTAATPTGAELRRGPLLEGDRVQLTDGKGRMHTITLSAGKEFHTHRGRLLHDDLIGAPDGTVVTNTAGMAYLALRPLLADYVMSMPRGAAVVYPKDSGQIVMMADIFPGATVVEAGVGSGALSMSLLRAVGDGGRLISFERREDFADIARGNVRAFFGVDHPAWSVVVGGLVDNGSAVHDKIVQGRLIDTMFETGKKPGEVVEEIYLRCLSRKPTEAELRSFSELCGAADKPLAELQDVFWAVLNSREFLFIH